MTLPEKYAFVDIETTGTNTHRDRIIEIAILRSEKGKLTHEYQTLLNPDTYLSPYIEGFTGIKTFDLENAPRFATVASEVEEILKDCVFVAHNVRFDYGFFQAEFARLGKSFSKQKCCTVKLSRALFPRHKHHDLDSLIKRFNLECEHRHRAMGDAKAIWTFFNILQDKFDEKKLVSAMQVTQKRRFDALKIPSSLLNSLPECPGVYIFQDKQGLPLYIGKSVNIKERVLSHFSQNTLGTDYQICQQAENIESIKTNGELGALIKEANLIKTMQPIYNRKLRRKHELTALIKHTTEEGYDTGSLLTVKRLTAEDTQAVLGLFKSKRQAVNFIREVAKKHSLCPKILGLESRCLHYQFGWCKGACINKETPLKYNLRFLSAFLETRIDPWPFNGPIAIKEEGIDTPEEIFYVDKWCLLEQDFDFDTYKILRRYLKKNRNIKTINTSPQIPYSFK